MKGLGSAVIQQSGVVAYASRALIPAEQRDARIEKAMLGWCLAVRNFTSFYMAKVMSPLNLIINL